MKSSIRFWTLVLAGIVVVGALITVIAPARAVASSLGFAGWSSDVVVAVVAVLLLLAFVVEKHRSMPVLIRRFVGLFSFEIRRMEFAALDGVNDLTAAENVEKYINYVVFESKSRRRIRLRLHGGYSHAYEECDSGMKKVIASDVISVRGPAHAGLKTLLLGESRLCEAKTVVFQVAETTWRAKGVLALDEAFRENCEQMMTGVMPGPHVVLVLRTDRIWHNDGSRDGLTDSVRKWHDSLFFKSHLTVVLRFESVNHLDVSDGKSDRLGNPDVGPGSGDFCIDYLTQTECCNFAKKYSAELYCKLKDKFHGCKDYDEEIGRYLISETRGMPGAIIEIMDQNLDARLGEIVLSQWNDLLCSSGVNTKLQGKYYAAFCLLSLLKGCEVCIVDFAKKAGILSDAVMCFFDRYFNGRYVDFDAFRVSEFTDLFPEESLMRYLADTNGDKPSEYRFINYFYLLMTQEHGKGPVVKWLHSGNHHRAEVLCKNLFSAFCQEWTPLSDVPSRIEVCLDFVDRTKDPWLSKRIRDLVAEFLSDYILNQVRPRRKIVPRETMEQFLKGLAKIGMRLEETGQRLAVMAQISHLFQCVCEDPRRWPVVFFQYLEHCLEDGLLDTREKRDDAFFTWAYAVLCISQLVGRGAEDTSNCAQNLVGRLNLMYKRFRLDCYPESAGFAAAIFDLADCNSKVASGFFGNQSDGVGKLSEAVNRVCCEVERLNRQEGRTWPMVHRCSLASNFDDNAFLVADGERAYKQVAVAMQKIWENPLLPDVQWTRSDVLLKYYEYAGLGSCDDDGWRGAMDHVVALFKGSEDEPWRTEKISVLNQTLYLLARRCDGDRVRQNDEWVRGVFNYLFSRFKEVASCVEDPWRLWGCVYVLRLLHRGFSPGVNANGFIRCCSDFIDRFDYYVGKLARKDISPLWEIASMLYDMNVEERIRVKIREVFESSSMPINEIEMLYKANFLMHYAVFCLMSINEDQWFDPVKAIERAMDVWKGDRGSRWQDFGQLKARGKRKLPVGLWQVATICICRTFRNLEDGTGGDRAFAEALMKGLVELERAGLIEAGAPKALLTQLTGKPVECWPN